MLICLDFLNLYGEWRGNSVKICWITVSMEIWKCLSLYGNRLTGKDKCLYDLVYYEETVLSIAGPSAFYIHASRWLSLSDTRYD